MTRPTIADVARLAGVSKSTVSRVINGNTRYIKPQTLERVQEAVLKLAYRPSSVARSLTSKRTQAVGLLISDIRNPFYADVIQGVEDTALANGYHVFLCNTNYNLERGKAYTRSLIARQVDGVLLMSSSVSDEWLQELILSQMPVIVLDWDMHGIDGPMRGPGSVMRSIMVDFEPGIRAAVDHLVGLGHRNIAHLSGPLYLWTCQQRQAAFLRALEANGIDPKTATLIEGNLAIDGGRRAIEQVLAHPDPPTAVFTANDMMAMGLVWAANEFGLRVPEDLSVIGLDDISIAAEIHPPLTTVSLPRYQIGRLAVSMLLEIHDSPPAGLPESQTISTGFVVRSTTAAPRPRLL